MANKPTRGETFELTVQNGRPKKRNDSSPSRNYKIGTNHKQSQSRREQKLSLSEEFS